MPTHEETSSPRRFGRAFLDPTKDYISIAAAMLPAILGLGISQGTFGVGAYSSSAYTEHPYVPDSAMVVASLIAVLVLAIASSRKRKRLEARTAGKLTAAGIAAQAASSFCLAASSAFGAPSPAAFAFSIGAAIGNVLVVSHWLRQLKEIPMGIVIATTFSSMVVSEALCTAFASAPRALACAAVGACAVLQIPLIRRPLRPNALAITHFSGSAPGYLDLARKQGYNPRFLLSCGAAIIVVSVAESILWGFPYGMPHNLLAWERIACGALSIVLLLGKARRESKYTGTSPISIWGWMQGLGLVSLFLYAAAPGIPALGMAFLISFSDVATAYTWCIIVAFMNRGVFDPHCYTVGGIMAFLAPGALARVSSLVLSSGIQVIYSSHFPNDMLIAAVVCALIMVPTTIVLASAADAQREEAGWRKSAQEALYRTLGISDEESAPTALRRAILASAVENMKNTFMLSEREREVLALYALGLTQSKIAEKLHISPSTAHSHITHIYAKTGLHSRQEIIDYLDEHT